MARPDFDLLDLPPDPPSSGASVMVFYDCEFTDISSASSLLSIGLVAADGDAELYIEIADANVSVSSDFVKKIVLPLFGRHTPDILTRVAAAARIETGWIPCVTAIDWPWIQEIYYVRGVWPSNVDGKPLLLTMNYLNNYDAFNKPGFIEQYSI